MSTKLPAKKTIKESHVTLLTFVFVMGSRQMSIKEKPVDFQQVPWVPEVLLRHAFVRCSGWPKAERPVGGRQRAAKPRQNL